MLNNLGPEGLFVLMAMLIAVITIVTQLVRKKRNAVLGWITGAFGVLGVIFAFALIANGSTAFFIFMAIATALSAVASFLAFKE